MVNIIATIDNMEIRGVDRKQSQQGKEYLIVSVDDARGKRSELYCRNVDKENEYTRGKIGTAKIDVTIGKYAKAELLDFTPDNA